MSGVEVVGLVLGAIPLLISGLEHYAAGMHTIKEMWDYEAMVEHLAIEFTMEQVIFRHSCQELLVPILPDNQAARLLEGMSPDWKDPELDQQLRKRLGPDYEIYTRATRNLNRQIKLFTKKLELDEKTMLPPWISNSKIVDKSLREKFFRHTWKRVKGGFDASRVTALLANIRSSIKQIDKFTKGSIAVAPKREELQQRATSRYWVEVRNHARRLFEIFNSRWSCCCPHPHRASLRLDICENGATRADLDVKFGIIFSFDVKSTLVAASLPWNWRDIDIKSSNSADDQAALSAKVHPSGAKRVTFSTPNSPNRSRASSNTRIEDLCETLARSPQGMCCIGYLGDSASRHDVYTTNYNMTKEHAQEIVGFYDLLHRRGSRGLGVKDKYKLALTIASAVLHLHATPWLREKWGLNDIHFLCENGKAQISSHIYVSKNFVSPAALPQPRDVEMSPTAQQGACVANEAIFALGVALIEISFGVPILSLKESSDPDLPGFTEFLIATRLVNQNIIKDNDHDKYAEVVLRCVRGSLSTVLSPLSLEEVKVQQCFYEDIILPLQQLNNMLYNKDSSIVI